jgi:UDP-2,3-diacylglucosamine hydrolase
MNALFVADLHLTPGRPEPMRRFTDFLERRARDADALYVLGDLFEYWIGDDAADALGYAGVMDALARLSASGTAAYFLPGNRDFLVGERFGARTGCRLLNDPTRVVLDGGAALLAHGDALCTDDTRHQRFRALCAWRPGRRGFLALPLRARLGIAEAIRRKSRRNKAALPPEIMDVNPLAVARAMRGHDVDILIHGHTHRPALHEFSLDGRPRRRYVLGAWYDDGSALSYRDGSFASVPV